MELLRGGFACIGLEESKLFLVGTLFHLRVFCVGHNSHLCFELLCCLYSFTCNWNYRYSNTILTKFPLLPIFCFSIFAEFFWRKVFSQLREICSMLSGICGKLKFSVISFSDKNWKCYQTNLYHFGICAEISTIDNNLCYVRSNFRFFPTNASFLYIVPRAFHQLDFSENFFDFWKEAENFVFIGKEIAKLCCSFSNFRFGDYLFRYAQSIDEYEALNLEESFQMLTVL